MPIGTGGLKQAHGLETVTCQHSYRKAISKTELSEDWALVRYQLIIRIRTFVLGRY